MDRAPAGMLRKGGHTAYSTLVADANGLLVDASMALTRVTNTWWDGDPTMWRVKDFSDWTLTADQLVLIPFFSPFSDWDEIAIEVTTAEAGKECKLALCNLGSDGLPGTKQWESSAIDLSSTGVKTKTLGSQSPPGWWLVGLNSNATGTAKIVRAPLLMQTIRSTGFSTTPGKYYTKAGVGYSGTPFPDSPSGLTAATSAAPWIQTRIVP